MNDTVIIVHPSNEIARSLSAQVTAISDTLVILESGSCEDLELLASEYGCALLIIEASLCPQDLTFQKLPQDTAILLLSEKERMEDYLNKATFLTRNCTISSSTSPPFLQHQVELLLKQRTTTLDLFQARKKITALTESLVNSNQALHTQQRYMDILSERDGLTGLYNRKYLATILRQEFKRARRYETDLSLLLLDIDHFKDTNLLRGHLFGDFVLNEIAARLTSNTRDSDLCFRFGGGNFVVLLPQARIGHALKAAGKLNRCCSASAFDDGKDNQKITISIGVASLCDSLPKSPQQLINMADRAMYQAKAKGRDRSQRYQDSNESS
jgi:diguanylate cyclase (GGDEF)-like protein